MQWDDFKYFLSKVISEGHRLQKVNISGRITTRRRFTHMQAVCLILAIVLCLLLPEGINDNFAEYAIAFLGIFVGLFTSVIISLYDKSKSLYKDFANKNSKEKAKIDVLRNYLVQFTGLTAYSIVLALLAVVLLLGILLFSNLKLNITDYHLVNNFSQIKSQTVLNFFKVFGAVVLRIGTFCLLLNFFIVTLFSLSSYFSFLFSEYKELGVEHPETESN